MWGSNATHCTNMPSINTNFYDTKFVWKLNLMWHLPIWTSSRTILGLYLGFSGLMLPLLDFFINLFFAQNRLYYNCTCQHICTLFIIVFIHIHNHTVLPLICIHLYIYFPYTFRFPFYSLGYFYSLNVWFLFFLILFLWHRQLIKHIITLTAICRPIIQSDWTVQV